MSPATAPPQDATIDADLASLYEWVDTVPLSRPRRNLARDFADAVSAAEVLHYFFPKHVDLHNYSPASCAAGRLYNWTTLRDKVLTPLGIPATRGDVEAAAAAAPGAAEWILALVRRRAGAGDRPPAPAWRGAVIDRGGWRTQGVTGTPARPSPGRSPAPEPREAPLPAPHDVERREEEEEQGAADEAAGAAAGCDDPAALRRAVAALERALMRAEARIEALTAQLAAVNGGGGGSTTSAKARFAACLSPRRGASPVRE